MKRISLLLTAIVLSAPTSLDARASNRTLVRPRQEPRVTSAQLKGKKLIVFGENFSDDAQIVLDGETVNTRNDSDNPSSVLIAKKAAKRIAADKIVGIAVMNATGVMSPVFELFSGLVLTLEDTGKTINLKVGDKFQVVLQKEGYTWTLDTSDAKLVIPLASEPLLPGAQGVFQATGAGIVHLSAVGELPCHQSNPPCSAPILGFQVTLVIQDAT
jgi:hypothetical protein